MSSRLNELTDLITQWGTDRFIVQNSTPFAQSRKTLEEVFELVEAAAKWQAMKDTGEGDEYCSEMVDAIGDIYVTLVMVCACNDTPLRMDLDFAAVGYAGKTPLDALCKWCPDLIRDCVEENTTIRVTARRMVCLLQTIAEEYYLDFVSCVEQAYDQIKNRKGYLRSDGVFVKEE
jgi:hypothetical protein